MPHFDTSFYFLIFYVTKTFPSLVIVLHLSQLLAQEVAEHTDGTGGGGCEILVAPVILNEL